MYFCFMDEIYRIALLKLPGVGGIIARLLVDYFGSAKKIFNSDYDELTIVPGIGKTLLSNLLDKNSKTKALEKAKLELDWYDKKGVKILLHDSNEYPELLKDCHDAPFILYLKGQLLNPERNIAIVGSRKSTHYGEATTDKIIEELKPFNVNIVSGLAYGIDAFAHSFAVKHEVPTTAVLAHGLDRIYPAQNRKLASQIIEQGGLLTDYPIGTNPDRENFPKRNRIVAGMSNATILVEAAAKGGALITADIAHSYSREVFAVPGRITDSASGGCNNLIKYFKAQILADIPSLPYLLGWEEKKKKPEVQTSLFPNLSDLEHRVVELLKLKGRVSQQIFALQLKLPIHKISAVLFNLELMGLVVALPGNIYELKSSF